MPGAQERLAGRRGALRVAPVPGVELGESRQQPVDVLIGPPVDDVDVERDERDALENGGDSPDDDEIDTVAGEELERSTSAFVYGEAGFGTT